MKINRLHTVVFLFLAILFMLSCSKKEDMPQSQTYVAYVSIVHAAPKAGALDFAFDNNRLNLNFFNYTDRTSYLNVFEGERTFSVFAKGATNTLVTKNLMLASQKNYTIFVIDDAGQMDAVLLKDSSRAPGADSARIRFANMSPDLGNLDLYIEGNSNPIATNVSTKAANDFISWKAANNVTLEVREAGQSTVVAKLEKQNLVSGYYYTVWISGLKTFVSPIETPRVDIFRH